MERIHLLVRIIRRYAIVSPKRYWGALDEDYKSVACALLILAFIVAFEPQIPW